MLWLADLFGVVRIVGHEESKSMKPTEQELLDLFGATEKRIGGDSMLDVKVKYFDKDMPKLEHVGDSEKSTWVDVRAVRVKINGEEVEWVSGKWQNVQTDLETMEETVTDEKDLVSAVSYEAGDYIQVYLGFAMELPKDKEGYTAPRGSTYKNYGLLQANSVGVVDESYRGDNDEWFIPYVALRDGFIEKYDRIGQMRIQDKMKGYKFTEVEHLGNENRGSHGSTGRG